MLPRWTSGTSFFDYSESKESDSEEREEIEAAKEKPEKPKTPRKNFLEFFLCFEENDVDDFKDDLANTLRKGYGSTGIE